MRVGLRGVPELNRALARLGDGPDSRRALQKAASAGAKTLKPFVQREAPRRAGESLRRWGKESHKPGTLRRSISARVAKRDRPAAVVSARPKIAFYRHFVILGTKAHDLRPRNNRPAGSRPIMKKRQLPNPFIERGFEAGREAAVAAIERVIDEYVEAATR